MEIFTGSITKKLWMSKLVITEQIETMAMLEQGKNLRKFPHYRSLQLYCTSPSFGSELPDIAKLVSGVSASR